jgi:hypothetical protein
MRGQPATIGGRHTVAEVEIGPRRMQPGIAALVRRERGPLSGPLRVGRRARLRRVDLPDAMELLDSLRPAAIGLSSEIGYRGGAAFLRMWQSSRPGRWAVIWTPGDRWFSLEVDGGYALDHFEEDTPDEGARQLLSKYVDVALAYVLGDLTRACRTISLRGGNGADRRWRSRTPFVASRRLQGGAQAVALTPHPQNRRASAEGSASGRSLASNAVRGDGCSRSQPGSRAHAARCRPRARRGGQH